MADTLDMNSAITQISTALDYDACESLLASGAHLDSVYAFEIRRLRGASVAPGPVVSPTCRTARVAA
jgi:hypothetical protein